MMVMTVEPLILRLIATVKNSFKNHEKVPLNFEKNIQTWRVIGKLNQKQTSHIAGFFCVEQNDFKLGIWPIRRSINLKNPKSLQSSEEI
jgi:hypothetical protein